MLIFFKTMADAAEYDKTDYTIKELTDKIAHTAGWHLGVKHYKNGHTSPRACYDKPFNDVLVAKWFMYYKDAFYKHLAKHPDVSKKDLEVYVCERTFEAMFAYYNPDKCKTNAACNQRFNMTLHSKIQEAEYYFGGTESRSKTQVMLDEQKKNGVETKLKRVINKNDIYSAQAIGDAERDEKGIQLSIDEDDSLSVNDLSTNTFIVDIKNKLSKCKLGGRLLHALLYSNGKIDTSNIQKYIEFTPDELNKEHVEETTKDLEKTWHIISSELESALTFSEIDLTKFDWDAQKLMKFKLHNGFHRNKKVSVKEKAC